jgi:ribonuclease P/MRP protein subunit RPP1
VFPANSDLAESSNPTENPEMQDIVAADMPQTQKRQREESRPSKKKRRRQNQEGVEVVI